MKIVAAFAILCIVTLGASKADATTLEITHGTKATVIPTAGVVDWDIINIGGWNWSLILSGTCCTGPSDTSSLLLDGVTYPASPPQFPGSTDWGLQYDLMGAPSLPGEQFLNVPFAATGQITVLDPVTGAPTTFLLEGQGLHSLFRTDPSPIFDLFGAPRPCSPTTFLCFTVDRFTFVPEPSGLLLLALGGAGLAFTHVRRRFGKR